MDNIQRRLKDLHNSDSRLRVEATKELWSLWYREAGEEAYSKLEKGTELMNQNHTGEAKEIFSLLVEKYPDFAEAHNKLATVFFLLGDLEESILECEVAVRMNPNHFGAWNGMGMCLYKLARYEQAIKSFQMALKIQPYADVNREYIARCRGKLN